MTVAVANWPLFCQITVSEVIWTCAIETTLILTVCRSGQSIRYYCPNQLATDRRTYTAPCLGLDK